jgi:hypothetical protein
MESVLLCESERGWGKGQGPGPFDDEPHIMTRSLFAKQETGGMPRSSLTKRQGTQQRGVIIASAIMIYVHLYMVFYFLHSALG